MLLVLIVTALTTLVLKFLMVDLTACHVRFYCSATFLFALILYCDLMLSRACLLTETCERLPLQEYKTL